MSKRTQKSIRASCDRLWSLLIRQNGFCERCGLNGRLEAHHAYGRANFRLRFEPRNGVAMCHQCHRWAESFPILFSEWFQEIRLADYLFLAHEHRKGTIRRTTRDYLELEAWLKDQLAVAA